jgi:glutamate racemase
MASLGLDTDLTSFLIIIDSGIGGLSIARPITGKNYVYFSDSKFAPYGGKSLEFIRKRLKKIITFFSLRKGQIFILACNTLTTQFIDWLRNEFPELQFFGVVPAIKPAGLRLKNKGIAILSSYQTYQSQYLADMIEKYAANIPTFNLYSIKMVSFLEKGDKKHALAEFKRTVQPYFNKIDGLVLGCTHFLLLIPEIQSLIPRGVHLFVPTLGVLNHVNNSVKLPETTSPKHLFFTTASPDKINQAVKKIVPFTTNFVGITV